MFQAAQVRVYNVAGFDGSLHVPGLASIQRDLPPDPRGELGDRKRAWKIGVSRGLALFLPPLSPFHEVLDQFAPVLSKRSSG